MIVTSKRCFLNVLTQLWPADRLLNANYYIGDQQANTLSMIGNNLTMNEYGQIESLPDMRAISSSFATVYHLKMDRTLDPEPFRAHSLIMGEAETYRSPEERYIIHLNSPETFLNVYHFLFSEKLEGNGLQVLIFADDPNLLTFGHIVCQYLSINFGVDIVFLDPQFRPTCRGYAQYHGNKEQGAKLVKEIRDYDLVFNFNQALSQSEVFASINNVMLFLQNLDLEQTVHLYGLLWPNDPLPPGNYSIDHIRQIIIGRCNDSMNFNARESALPNLMMINNWQNIVDRSSREDADFAGDDTGLF